MKQINPTTPDGRYFVVKEQLWRCSNPALDEDERQRWVNDLMAARRDVKAAKASGDPDEMKAARSKVQKILTGTRSATRPMRNGIERLTHQSLEERRTFLLHRHPIP